MGETPTPWTASYDDNGFYVVDAPGRPSPYIVATGGEGDADKANAALIVKAVNGRAALRAALEGLANEVSGLVAFEPDVRAVISNTNWRCIMDRVAAARRALEES